LAGGELDDIAASAGIEPGVAALVSAIALPATLATADVIVLKHDIMEVLSGGGETDQEPYPSPELGEYPAIEKMAWVNRKTPTGEHGEYLADAQHSLEEHSKPFDGVWYDGRCTRGYCEETHATEPEVPARDWVLEFSPEGSDEWVGAAGAWAPEGSTLKYPWVNPKLTKQPHCGKYWTVSEGLFIPGFPSDGEALKNFHQFNVQDIHKEGAEGIETCLVGPEGHEEIATDKILEYEVSTIKGRAGLHVGFPHEATYSGGLPKQEPTLTPVTGVSPLESSLTKVLEGLKSEVHLSAEKVLDHGGHVHKKGEPETLPGYTVVPSCRTLSVSACESLLKEYELESYTVTPLGWKTADLSVELEHIVKTEPAEGTEVEVGKHIVIRPNPEATEVNQLAETLQSNNVGTELTSEDLKTVAARCLKDTALGEVEASKCESLPIFLSGSDVQSATEHDIRALEEHPQWIKLNYESATAKEEKGEERKWYKGLGGCSGTAPEGDSCDEYPFFASQQGGGKAEIFPSLKWINEEDNSKQGGKYGNFVTSCAMAARSSTDYAFLAIPLAPATEIPTSRLCN
jgi:hypothetical protein